MKRPLLLKLTKEVNLDTRRRQRPCPLHVDSDMTHATGRQFHSLPDFDSTYIRAPFPALTNLEDKSSRYPRVDTDLVLFGLPPFGAVYHTPTRMKWRTKIGDGL